LASCYNFPKVTHWPYRWTIFFILLLFSNWYSYSGQVFCMEVKILPCLHFATFIAHYHTFKCTFLRFTYKMLRIPFFLKYNMTLITSRNFKITYLQIGVFVVYKHIYYSFIHSKMILFWVHCHLFACLPLSLVVILCLLYVLFEIHEGFSWNLSWLFIYLTFEYPDRHGNCLPFESSWGLPPPKNWKVPIWPLWKFAMWPVLCWCDVKPNPKKIWEGMNTVLSSLLDAKLRFYKHIIQIWNGRDIKSALLYFLKKTFLVAS
jgi:hypothetical protein